MLNVDDRLGWVSNSGVSGPLSSSVYLLFLYLCDCPSLLLCLINIFVGFVCSLDVIVMPIVLSDRVSAKLNDCIRDSLRQRLLTLEETSLCR